MPLSPVWALDQSGLHIKIQASQGDIEKAYLKDKNKQTNEKTKKETKNKNQASKQVYVYTTS